VVVPTQLLYSTTSLTSIVVGKTEVLSGNVLDLSLVKITDVQWGAFQKVGQIVKLILPGSKVYYDSYAFAEKH
jgi:hypothetical protein